MKQGRVNRDLISSVDFLPTICQVAGAPLPKDSDGVSFLSQLRGEQGTPREWLYGWYSPRQRLDLTVREFAFNHDFKLYRTGQFLDLAADPFEEKPLNPGMLTKVEAAAKVKLQKVLDQFKDARPAGLDRQFEQSMKDQPTGEKKARKKQ
jgi:arylsulfatase A